ncbi:glycosyltransferase family 4 protein [Paenibacillus puldeungensis]|uniref:Glycosyltransferase family 4 protein n=1 Tax=Paenibacillus puldeungensis TaxID=696536 RepID=A0ABW3S2H3_9BACL
MSRRKKLFLFTHVSNLRNITGAEKLLLFLAKRFSAHFDCTLVAPQEGRLTYLARKAGLMTMIRDAPLLYGMCSPYENLTRDAEEMMRGKEAAHVIKLLTEQRPDVVFVNTSVNIVPAMAAKSLGIPVVWHITEFVADNPYTEQATQLIERHSDLIIGISETTLLPFRKGESGDKLGLLFPSWDGGDIHPKLWPQLRQSKRREWGIRPGETVVGYISSFLIAQKGPEHFIQAALEVARGYPEVRFVIIGGEVDREFYRSLRRKAAEATGRPIVFINHEESIEAAYSAMDITVIPSLVSEGFGMTAMEAMFFGKPVIAYASGGLQEIFNATGNDAYLVKTGETPELAAKISELLASPETMKLVGESNRVQVESAFGPAAYMGRFLEMVRRVDGLVPSPENDLQSVNESPGDSSISGTPIPVAVDSALSPIVVRRRSRLRMKKANKKLSRLRSARKKGRSKSIRKRRLRSLRRAAVTKARAQRRKGRGRLASARRSRR